MLKRTALLALVLLPASLLAQQRRLTGTVRVEGTAEPLSGAIVSVINGMAATQTDEQGRFGLTIPSGSQRLRVRALGYGARDIAAPSSDTLTVFLTRAALTLDQVVVTGQATVISKRNAITSTSNVDSAELNRVPAPSVDIALAGKIAGANIQTNSGAPGGGAQIQIRGSNTVIGASDPLIVVDGVIFSNASIPSGLYTVTGSGSASGNGPTQDDVANRLADLNPNDIVSIEVLKSAAASSIYGSKAANGVVIITTNRGQAGKPRAHITQRLGWSSLLRGPGERAFDTTSAFAVYSSAGDSAIIRSLTVNGKLPVFDHLKELAGGNAPASETQLDVGGGTGNTTYYVSGDIKRDNGIVHNTYAERQTVRLNLSQHLTDRVSLSMTSAFARNANDRGFINNDNTGAGMTYALAYIPSFVPLVDAQGRFRVPEFTYLGSNPLQTAALGRNRETVNRFTGGATLNADAWSTDKQSLKLVAAAGADIFNQRDAIVAPPDLYFQERLQNPGASTLSNGDARYVNWNLNAIHSYTPGARFRTTTSGGLQYEDRQLQISRVTARGLLPGQTNITQGSVFGEQQENLSTERTVALYAQEQVIALDERLTVEAGLRAERSSVFGNTNKFFVFPKTGASFRFPDLLGAGSDFKLRAAYGETGNQPLFGQKFTTLSTSVIGGNVGTNVAGTSGAPNIEPERVKEIEGGFDAAPWGGRATLELTGYKRRTTNLLLNRTPAPSTGFTQVILNGGQLSNEGIEAALALQLVRRGDFTWLYRTTYSHDHSNVDNLPVPGFRPPTAGFGLAYGEFFLQPGRPIDQIIGQTAIDQNGDFVVGYMGHASPTYQMSFGNDFTYRFATLSLLIDMQKGGVAQNQTLSLYDCNQLAPDQGTPAGQARSDACLNTGLANPFVQSTDFVRLRELRVGLTVPRQYTHFFGSDDVQLIFSGRNLWLHTKYFGYDPESSNYGQQAITRNVDLGPYPPSRQFLFSLSVGF
ncbi:MAG TPA: SusC/RagA family TonB-linked outer membrane protein [Gemmatimonadaceae bacterium]|nr:SusC/RagA family TonB-linked outer membrane protein [Gemmatimonadaceae bacterium]